MFFVSPPLEWKIYKGSDLCFVCWCFPDSKNWDPERLSIAQCLWVTRLIRDLNPGQKPKFLSYSSSTQWQEGSEQLKVPQVAQAAKLFLVPEESTKLL